VKSFFTRSNSRTNRPEARRFGSRKKSAGDATATIVRATGGAVHLAGALCEQGVAIPRRRPTVSRPRRSVAANLHP
jgi:hypothetical protein